MSSGYPGWTKPGPYYDPYNEHDGPPWIEEAGESDAERRRRRLLSLLSYVGVAVVAAGIAVALTLILHGSPAQSSGAATPPANQGQGQNVGPPGGGGTQQQMLMIAGTVTKISRTSITISGPNGDVTAAITDSTQISGIIKSAQDIKVGDHVAAQISGTNGNSVATAIRDPAQVP